MVSWSAGLSVIVVAVILLHLADAVQQVPNPDAVLAGSECLSEAPRPSQRQCPVEVADLKHVVPAPRTPRPNLKFALLEYGDLFQSVIECFLQKHGINLEEDNWDDHLRPAEAEHMGELWLLKKLQHHPQRTMDATKADVNILAIPAFVSLTSGKSHLCGDSAALHHDRMETVAKRIESSTLWRSKGHAFFIASTHYSIGSMFSPGLLKLFQASQASVGTGDVNYHHWGGWKKGIRRVVLPYKAHYLAETKQIVQFDDISSRTIDVFYHGCVGHSPRMTDRKWLLGLEKIIPRTDIKNVCVAHEDGGEEVSRGTSNLYKFSRFCLVPAGDTPTSRRLFDSLGSGCVPVYLGDASAMTANLPFARTIDWSEVVLFGGDRRCGPVSELAKWFKPILRNETLWQIMSKKGRAVYHKYLSYTKADQFVTAMLDEIVED